jgi:uncharacterized protein with von Willebrand factor type A (vWA) domain
MRITKLLLEPEEIKQIEALTDEITSANKDITLAYDFAKDAYALFKEKVNKRRTLKSYWDIFSDIRTQYTKFKMMDLMKNVDFYGRVRNFFRYFMTSRFFHELDKLDPIEALKIFLNMFQPPQQQQQQQPQPPQPKQDQEEEEQEDKKQKSKQQDQGGRSASEDNLPIDMTKFKQQLPKIEKALDSGILDKEDFQDYLGKHAGVGHNELKIGNILELIDKISKKLSDRELEIFYVARKKEATELYRRDEVLESVPFPDDEMTIKNLDNPMEILKLVPTQYAYDDDIFMQKLVKHELLVKDYQARRLKRQALYLLIDVSGSMSGAKNVYACGVALAFVRQAITEGSTYFLRFFDDSPHDLQKVTTKEEAEKMSEILIKQPFSGGGTSIQSAIGRAVDDITKSPEDFEKAEIMVISDGEDTVNLNKDDLKEVKLHSTIIDGENKGLELISQTYLELRSDEL